MFLSELLVGPIVDGSVYFLCLIRGGDLAGTYGPDGLVGDDDLAVCGDGKDGFQGGKVGVQCQNYCPGFLSDVPLGILPLTSSRKPLLLRRRAAG